MVEGDSEQIVLRRVFAATGISEDDVSVSVVPLGGRHVNHFWRLLEQLGIPYITLLDLDCGRYQGGWGRVSYAAKQLNKFRPDAIKGEDIDDIPAWNENCDFPRFDDTRLLRVLEDHGLFFSYPLDLDLMLLEAYPDAYNVSTTTLEEATKEAVLGKTRANVDRFDDGYLQLFDAYMRQFKRGSKPASHIAAMSELTDEELLETLPGPLQRLVEAIQQRLESIPE